MKKLLELREKIKKKKPKFIRQNKSKKSLEEKWRQPKGMHSSLRKKRLGKGKHPSPGYSSPKAVRGLHKTGLKQVVVNNVPELTKLDAKTEGAVIHARVGKKKKVEMLKEAEKQKITVLNVKDPKTFIKNVEDLIAKKKETKKQKEERKEKTKKELAKKAEEKKKAEEGKTSEEKQKEEKEMKKKILESKEA